MDIVEIGDYWFDNISEYLESFWFPFPYLALLKWDKGSYFVILTGIYPKVIVCHDTYLCATSGQDGFYEVCGKGLNDLISAHNPIIKSFKYDIR